MTYEEAKELAQRMANWQNVEYGIRRELDGNWRYSEASWYATVHKRRGWSLDNIELILPCECKRNEDMDTWQKIYEYQDNYDGAPNE